MPRECLVGTVRELALRLVTGVAFGYRGSRPSTGFTSGGRLGKNHRASFSPRWPPFFAIDGGLFVRQRLSSEPDRYRGRRRVPTPPRSRYAVVGAAAFLGAGAVAIGAASNLPDQKAVNPDVLQGLESAHVASDALAARDNHNAASRGEDRSAVSKNKVSADVNA